MKSPYPLYKGGINVPLRLDIAGSYTDLPGYREQGGMHLATSLDYVVSICPATITNSLRINDFVQEMNYRAAWLLGCRPQPLAASCALEHNAGLGGSSATVVGLVKWYAQTHPYPSQEGTKEPVMSPGKIAQLACKGIEQTSICGRQDEFCAAFAQPLYLYYQGNETTVQPFEWPEEFRKNIETWHLLYTPRTIPCQEMLDYEMKANFDIKPIIYFTKLMYKAIQQANWDDFWKWYIAHWKFVEEQNPRKINDAIRELREQYPGIYIRPCGAGAGGYLLVHGEIANKKAIKIKLL